MQKIAKNLIDLVGHTRLMELSAYSRLHGLSCPLVAKLEMFNPSGSVKARTALAMIEDPMEEGGYSSMHIRCFDKYGNSTGKCTATSYWSPIGKGVYHSHGCSYCCS